MRRYIVFILLFAFPASISAYTKEQENVLNHLANGFAAAELCPDLELNDTVGASMMMFNLKVEDISEVVLRALQLREAFEKQDRDALCVSAELLYGPKGINVPGLLVAKNKSPAVTIDDLLSDAGRFAKFWAYVLTVEAQCVDYYVDTDAVMGSHLSAEDYAIATERLDIEKPEAEEVIRNLSCRNAANLALKYTDLPFEKVWTIEKK